MIAAGAGDNGDVHALLPFDFVQVNFGKDGLITDTERIISAAIEGAGGEAAKIANPRQGGRDEAIEEFIHGIAAKSDAAADGLAFAQLEIGDAVAGFADGGLASGDQREIFGGVINGAFFERSTDAHVHDNL